MNEIIYNVNDVIPVEFDEKNWTSAGFQKNGEARIALRLLEQLNGLTVGQIKQVLHQAEILLDATTVHDCSATSFQQAAEGYRRVSGESI